MSDYSDLPDHDDPVDGFDYCPCGTCYVMALGCRPTRTAVCAACNRVTGPVPTSPELKRWAASQRPT